MTKRPVPLLSSSSSSVSCSRRSCCPGAVAPPREAPSSRPFHLRTGFGVGAWDGGYYTAKAKGFYAQAGLNVVIDQGQGSFSNIQLVAAGKADIVSAASPAEIQFAAQGAKLKMIASFIQSSGSGSSRSPRSSP